MSPIHQVPGSLAPPKGIDKSLPELPKISVASPQWRNEMETEACPSPTVRKHDASRTSSRTGRARMPPFQQSKRWAKTYRTNQSASPLPPPAPISKPAEDQPVDDNGDRVMTMREVSFEQQRAEMKRPVSHKSNSDRPRRTRQISRGSSTVQDEGLCRSSATQYWKTVKATVVITPHKTAKKCFGRRPACRRVSLARHRDSKSGRTAEKVAVPSKVQGVNKQQRSHVSTPTKDPASPHALPNTKASTISHGHQKRRTRGKTPQSRSPLPSLHDPEKDSRFSEECRAILRSVDFNRDLLLPGASLLPAATPLIEKPASEEHNQTEVFREEPAHEISRQDTVSSVPGPVLNDTSRIPAITVLKTPAADNSPRRPDPPARASSKTVVSLAAMMRMSKHGDFPSVSESSSNPSANAQAPTYADTPATQFSGQMLRVPSTASATGPPALSPRSVISTDTLTKIEAQVHSGSHGGYYTETNIMSMTGSDGKSGGPPSIPPERPLPALPAQTTSETGSARYYAPMESRRGSKEKTDLQSEVPTARSTIRLLRNSWQSSPPVSSLRPATLDVNGGQSAELISLSSLKREGSRSSLASSRSFNRHTISGPRADKVKERRLRDLASSRSHSPKSDGAGSSAGSHEQTTTPVVTDDDATGHLEKPIDQLDQFPAVPFSRPPSLPGAGSPSRHTRQQSTASQPSSVRQLSQMKHRRNSRPVQHLSQSNIFVVVDSDPVTARFRAGAMSPTPSIGGGHGRSGSPYKHTRTGSNLREVTTHDQSPARSVKQKSSSRSLRGEDDGASARSPRAKPAKPKRATARNSRGRLSSSSEDSLPRSANSPRKGAHRPQKRRRWNSSDISLIKILHQDLEEYYGTILQQEEKLKWQASQLHMMVRVLEPINRARGVKTPCLDDAAYYTTTDEETSGSVSRIEQASGSAPEKGQQALRPGLQVPGRQSSGMKQSHHRSNSAGNDDTASTTGSISTDVSKTFADDASMTDPFDEYDPPPSATLKPAPLLASLKRPNDGPTVVSDDTVASSPTLHAPPPVSRSVPRVQLPEEKLELLRPATYGQGEGGRASKAKTRTRPSAADLVYQSFDSEKHSRGNDHDEKEGEEKSETEDQRRARDAARLSVNHVLTSTEQMDRAIEQLIMYT